MDLASFAFEDGVRVVRRVRDVVEATARNEPPSEPPDGRTFLPKMGVFVTLLSHPAGELRSCIGFPEPEGPLGRAVVLAAKACCRDPRFEPLLASELDTVIVEVSLLSPPEPIPGAAASLASAVQIGRDGLIAERGVLRGLLLPQVAIDHGLGPEEFLEETCHKAGLDPSEWRSGTVRFYRFSSRIFSEVAPRGPVVERGWKGSDG